MKIGTELFAVSDVYINFYCGEGESVCFLVYPSSSSVDIRHFPYDRDAPSLADTRLFFSFIKKEGLNAS